MPKTNLGKWSIGLIIAMPLLFVIAFSFVVPLYEGVSAGGTILADIIQRPALALTMLAGMASGVSAFITGALAGFRSKERAILVYASTVIGALFTVYLIAEIMGSH